MFLLCLTKLHHLRWFDAFDRQMQKWYFPSLVDFHDLSCMQKSSAGRFALIVNGTRFLCNR